MDIVNFGLFTPQNATGILHYANEDGQDWYDLRAGLTSWNDRGEFVDAIYGAWAMVDPASLRVTNVEYDPSRLVPDNKIVLGVDAEHGAICAGMLYTNGTLVDIPVPPSATEVDMERDRRIDGGFVFEGVRYQSAPENRENIAGAKSAATDAITLFGAKPGDYGWQRLLDPTAPPEFRWIATDNGEIPMDAYTTMRLGYAAMNHKQAHIFAARAIKDMPVIPADFASNESYWPA